MADKFIALWNILLDTDDGITEQAYDALLDLGESICPEFLVTAYLSVDATDGRFYIKSNAQN